MDIATLIGMGAGVVLVVGAIILGGNAGIFINVPSIIIVVGGTLAATVMKYSLPDMANTASVIMKSFFTRSTPPLEMIDRIKELADVVRREGMLALEGRDFGDAFLAKGLGMLIDGTEPEQVSSVLERDLYYMRERHKKGQSILKGMGASAPAFGMIGTLIGLVQMLAAMDDPSNIGPAMAVALLTTLYGAVIANVICLPMADKLDLRSKEETLIRELILAGIGGIVRGDHPRLIEEHLKVFLSPKERPDEDEGGGK